MTETTTSFTLDELREAFDVLRRVCDVRGHAVLDALENYCVTNAMLARGFLTVLDGAVDDEGAYEPDDPKGPRYHSTHADIWDNRDKTAGLP